MKPRVWLVAILAVFAWVSLAYAQALPISDDNIIERVLLWILGQSTVITLIVNALKRNPWVASHPKATAAILNTVTALAAIYGVGVLPGGTLVTFLEAVSAAFASVGFYEYAVKPGISIVIPPK